MTGQRPRKGKQQRQAQTADKHLLYQNSVQAPEEDVRMFTRAYQDAFRCTPLRLREDFSGTGAVCAAWVRSRPDREALGIDLDPETIAWGLEHNVSELTAAQQHRIQLRQGDAREVSRWKADVVVVGNFSFYTLLERVHLKDYLQSARKNLRAQGVLLLQMMGGWEVMQPERWEHRKFPGFSYYWQQDGFDPITHHGLCHIHYAFKDGSILKDAFSYPWRIWSIPEVRELLEEVGYTRSEVYWADTDHDTGGTTGLYKRRKHAPAEAAWLAWVAAIK